MNPRRSSLLTLVLLACICLCSGCATGVRKYAVDITGVKNFIIEPSVYATSEFSADIAQVLEEKGYTRAEQAKQAISIRIEGSDASLYNTWRSIVAEYRGRPLLILTAKNGGFGTLIAPGAAEAELRERCIANLRKQMPIFAPGTPSAPGDAPPETADHELASFGSGFLVSSTGHFVTAHHVVEGATRIEVVFSDGKARNARVVRTLPAVDLALLLVDDAPAARLQLVSAGELQIGTPAFTVGFPTPELLGQGAKYSDGSVSGLEGPGGDASFVQITVPVQPGNSGGPLVNESGEVIGVIVAKLNDAQFLKATGTLPQNINFAVRAQFIRALLELPSSNDRVGASLERQDVISRTVAATGLVRVYQGVPN